MKGQANVDAPKVEAERQVALYAKQPLVRFQPFCAVEVPAPTVMFFSTKRFVVDAKEPVALVKDKFVTVSRRTKASVVEERVRSAMPSVEDALLKFWIVEEPRAISEFGMETRPKASTLKSEVVAFPPESVVDAISKSGIKEPYAPWRESFAQGDEVPMVTVEEKRFWSVEEAVDISPPPKLIKVEVETPV